MSTATPTPTATSPATSASQVDPFGKVNYISLNLTGLDEPEQTYYTVPAGCIAIVRSIFALCTSDNQPSAFDCRLNDLYLCRFQALPVANPYEHIEDNTVLMHAGDQLRFRRSADGPCDVHVNLLEQAVAA